MSQTPKDTEGKKMKKQIIPVTISKKSNNMDYHKKLALHKRKNVMRMLITPVSYTHLSVMEKTCLR